MLQQVQRQTDPPHQLKKQLKQKTLDLKTKFFYE